MFMRACLASQGVKFRHLGSCYVSDGPIVSLSLVSLSVLLSRCVAYAEWQDEIYEVDVGVLFTDGHPHCVRSDPRPGPLSFWMAEGLRYYSKCRRRIVHRHRNLGTRTFLPIIFCMTLNDERTMVSLAH